MVFVELEPLLIAKEGVPHKIFRNSTSSRLNENCVIVLFFTSLTFPSRHVQIDQSMFCTLFSLRWKRNRPSNSPCISLN